MTRLLTILVLCSIRLIAPAQGPPGYNYDEAAIKPYTLLDPLRFNDGRQVKTPTQWTKERRPEIIRLFEENVFGRTPAEAQHAAMHVRVIEQDEHALGGLAVRKQIELTFDPAPGVIPPATAQRSMRLLLYVPVAHHHAPVVLGLNFGGNHAVLDDPGIQPSPVWTKSKGRADLVHAAPPESTRGGEKDRWQVRLMLERGYAFATICYGDLEPDFKEGLPYSMRLLFRPADQPPQPDDWAAIGLWAWGLSRALDYLEHDPLVDAHHVAVTGHSRLGKAADWAAAQDTRFAALLSNESGHGGQTIQRRVLGETVEHLEIHFPYWFAPAYARFVGRDAEIPADGNLLLALSAPRPMYVGSAVGDAWSDPHGEFLAALSASRVYRLLGKPALASNTPMPSLDQPVGLDGNVAYHERSGLHNVTRFDWEHYLDFLDRQWGTAPATARSK